MSFFFLTPDIICMPNMAQPSLQFFNVSLDDAAEGEPGEPQLVRTLLLPELTRDSRLYRIACRSEPNPSCSPTTGNGQEPFSDSAEDAVVLLNFHIQNTAAERFGHFIHLTVIVHRNSLKQWIPGIGTDCDSTFPLQTNSLLCNRSRFSLDLL